jgi:hypothetical protein
MALHRAQRLGHLVGRSQFAVQPGNVRSNWVLSQHPLNALALRTFECPQNGAGRARFDPGQNRARLASAASWSLDRDKRWLDGIATKHCDAHGPDGDDPSVYGRPRVCDHLSTQAHEVRRRPHHEISELRHCKIPSPLQTAFGLHLKASCRERNFLMQRQGAQNRR